MEASYPDTKEKRQAGMAMVRARMLAAHQRAIARGDLKDGDLAVQHKLVEIIKAEQKKRGEA